MEYITIEDKEYKVYRPKKSHAYVILNGVHIDINIAPLILKLWSLGIETLNSCERGYLQLKPAEAYKALLYLNINVAEILHRDSDWSTIVLNFDTVPSVNTAPRELPPLEEFMDLYTSGVNSIVESTQYFDKYIFVPISAKIILNNEKFELHLKDCRQP